MKALASWTEAEIDAACEIVERIDMSRRVLERLRTLSTEELYVLTVTHITADWPIFDPRTDLIDELFRRLGTEGEQERENES